MRVVTELLSAGGNRHPSAADWDEATNILAFGAGCNVALWKPLERDRRGVFNLLRGHADTVNAVHFMKCTHSAAKILLTGSSDNTIRVWSTNDEEARKFRCEKVLKVHERSVNCVASTDNVFASGAADGLVKIWHLQDNEQAFHIDVELKHSIKLQPKFLPLALSIAKLPGTKQLLLAVGGSKSTVQLYTLNEDLSSSVHHATLTGHEGWIRSLDFVRETSQEDGDMLLASASQDKYIRLWRVHRGKDLPHMRPASDDPYLESAARSLSNKAHWISTEFERFSITFEALLLGHEDWIFTAKWDQNSGTPRLLSASADNSLAIWEADAISGVWICTVRLGEISAQKGATTATGSTGGFWIGLWGLCGTAVVCLGRTGGWRLWRHSDDGRWVQDLAVTGHTREVKGLSWSSDGSYLLSTSSDQTTRLFARCDSDDIQSWHEFSRPQIHGYDLNCLDTISASRFISGADEKLLRVFDMSKAVANHLSELCAVKTVTSENFADAANIPVLGLSNKAVDAATEDR